jgi:hypothetical protein
VIILWATHPRISENDNYPKLERVYFINKIVFKRE